MTKGALAATSLVAVIPGGFLAYLTIRAFLDHADKMATMLQVVTGTTLLMSVLLVLMPFAILLFMRTPVVEGAGAPASGAKAGKASESGAAASPAAAGAAAVAAEDEFGGDDLGEADLDETSSDVGLVGDVDLGDEDLDDLAAPAVDDSSAEFSFDDDEFAFDDDEEGR